MKISKKEKKRKLKNEIKQSESESKEYEFYKNNISRMFKSKTTEKRFEKILNNLEQLPPEISTFIKKLKNNFQKTIKHTQHKFLPSTNNLIELYYGITLPQQLKRKYRTIKGLTIKLRMSKIRLHQRNVLKTKT
jgi:hypothetical protein